MEFFPSILLRSLGSQLSTLESYAKLLEPKDGHELEMVQPRITLKGVFACISCPFKTRKSSRLIQHQFIYHPLPNSGQRTLLASSLKHSCPKCGYRPAFRNQLAAHKKLHKRHKNRIYLCQYCNYRSATSASLKEHERSHTGEKPYCCHLCQFRAARLSSFKLHKKTHEDFKPFLCSHCPYRTWTKENLNHHLSVNHLNFNSDAQMLLNKLKQEKLGNCPYCDFKTDNSTTMAEHKRNHIEVKKPYSCHLCEYRSSDILSLDIHKEGHLIRSLKVECL